MPVCPAGFADNSTNNCESTCPDPTYADSLTSKCETTCTGNQLGEDNVCIDAVAVMCTEGLYGNPLTKVWELTCPDFGYTFAENNTNMCVSDCSAFPSQYADRSTNICMDFCSQEF